MELVYRFDPNKWRLGTLCIHGHRWPGTDASLRRLGNPLSSPCAGCRGRKQSDWLISFIDTEAMGLPAGWKFGKLCKKGHRWNGHEMTLKDQWNKCVECEKERGKNNKEYMAAYRAANKDRIRELNRARLERLKQDPEWVKKERQRAKTRNKKIRKTIGRPSNAQGLGQVIVPPGCGFDRKSAAIARQLISEGVAPIYEVLAPLIKERLKIEEMWQDVMTRIGRSPSVAKLVMLEQRRYWQENPEAHKSYQRQQSQNRWRFRYMIDPDLRLYTRQKSKRRKADMRNSVALNLSASQVRERFAEFGDACAYCGDRAGGADKLHIEHVVPISKGGTHALGNIVPACRSCNYSKRSNDAEAWYPQQSFYSELRWRKICKVLGWSGSSIGQMALL